MTAFAIALWVGFLALCVLGLSRLQLRKTRDALYPTPPMFPVKHLNDEASSLQPKPVLPHHLQALFWQVVEARKGLSLAGHSQAMILASVPFASLMESCGEDRTLHQMHSPLAELVIVDAQFLPLVVLSTSPLEGYIKELLIKAGIGYVHAPANMGKDELMMALYKTLPR
ncbi:hypothetical protein [Zymobacter palmae]|uniref:hypothetical protein n=1 Tax=Zymobacter palmae TaxID=33074 RepID=UPI000481207F|nr:hypothetical protein [Zymobacter palmae]